MSDDISRPADVVQDLVAACRAVVSNWDHGDLAAAARLCSEALRRASEAGLAPTEDLLPAVYYKVWISIEECDEAIDSYEDVGLPDSLGKFDSLEEAEEIVRAVLGQYAPQQLEMSDHRGEDNHEPPV
jgi:hypothetical protein